MVNFYVKRDFISLFPGIFQLFMMCHMPTFSLIMIFEPECEFADFIFVPPSRANSKEFCITTNFKASEK